MSMQNHKRKPIAEGTVLKQVSFTDNDSLSALDGNYFAEGNTYRRDLKILRQHSQKGESGKLSSGSTCLVYDGRLGDLDVIVKEFYPDTEKGFFYIERSDDEEQKLYFHEITENGNQEFNGRKKQFLTGYQNQKEYVQMEELREIITLPLGLGRYGQSYYIVSPVNQGVTLDAIGTWKDTGEKVKVLLYIADMLRILEKRNILYLDLAPENLLYVKVSDMVQQIKLFDVEGFIDLNNKDDVHEISFHPDYVWPELVKHLVKGRSFDRQKDYYLVPYAAVYSFGVIACEILFGHIPTMEERDFSDTKNQQDMKSALYDEGTKWEICGELTELLRRIFTDDMLNAETVYQILAGIHKKLQQPKNGERPRYDESGNLYFCYDLMQKYPLYQFADKVKDPETGKTGYRMDVTVIGDHKFRESFLKAALPCGQMLNSDLTIRLIAHDASEFWKEFSEDQNPELQYAVNCYDGEMEKLHDPRIVDGELANIYLYNTGDTNEIVQILNETKSRYLVLVDSLWASNGKGLLSAMQKIRYGKKPVFTCFYGLKKDVPKTSDSRIILPFVPLQAGLEYAGGNDRKSNVYRMGLQIHYNYELTKNPRASLKEIEETTYAGNAYNRTSSERAALHMIYKLASIGITDLAGENLLSELKKKLYGQTDAAKQNFEALIWLEHKSWTAHQILNGWRRLPMEEFKDFAYEGSGNTWKDNKNKRHPYIVSSKPKRTLEHPEGRNLDELDRVCLKVYEGLREKAADRRRNIDVNLQDIDNCVEREKRSQFERDFQWLKNSIGDCYGMSPRTNVGLNWEQAVKAFAVTVSEMAFPNEGVKNRINSRLEEIKGDMEPILEAIKRSDIKISDADVVRSIPQILTQTMGLARLIMVRPVTGKVWENILGTLMIRPRSLVFVARETDTIDLDYYRRLLDQFGLSETTIRKVTPSSFRAGGLKGQLLLDFTGLAPFEVYSWMQKPVSKECLCFDIHDMKIRAWNDDTVEMLPYDVHLTVKETLELTGGQDMTEIQFNASAQLSEEQYKIIWNTYRKVSGFRWRVFISALNRELGKLNFSVDLSAGVARSYKTGYIYYRVLEETGLKAIFKKCESLGFIEDLKLPQSSEQGNYVSFTTAYVELGNAFNIMVSNVTGENANPYQFCYVLRSWNEEKIQIYNKTLYCSMEVPHTLMPGQTSKDCQDEIMERCLRNLNPAGKENVVIQNLKVTHLAGGSGKRFSFVFASDAVREVMKTEGSCLEVMIYFECLRNKIFDDVRLNSKVYWGDSKINNEIDVIGIKNNKSYFISVKMAAPEIRFLQEIAQITEQFSMVGQPILISSHYTTREDTEETELVLRSKLMGVKYIGMNQIYKSDGTLIIADTIREIVG